MAGLTRAKLAKFQRILSSGMICLSNACPRWINSPCTVRRMSLASANEDIIIEKRGKGGCVGVVTMNRPKVLNRFTNLFMLKLGNAIRNMDSDPGVAAIVLTGGDKVFCSGGDIRGMQDLKFQDCYWKFMENFDTIVNVRKPVIAAVNGYAVGGGCELAMRCDIVLAGENAKFGIPDSKIGAIAGGGGTQWLPHIIGKSRAMQMCLLGETITAQQADEWGLVSSVHPANQVVDEAVQLGEKIAQRSKLIVAMCKESINNSYNLPLSQGLHSERRLSNMTFATNDRLEGMTAFAEKRTPKYTDS